MYVVRPSRCNAFAIARFLVYWFIDWPMYSDNRRYKVLAVQDYTTRIAIYQLYLFTSIEIVFTALRCM